MSDPENPVLKLDAKGLLDFIDSQNRKEREYFDRLLKWFAAGIAVVIGLFAVLGIQNWNQVRKISDAIREETQKQLIAAVSEELTKAKIQDQIGKVLQRTTDAQFQDAINKAVTEELNTPQRQRLLEAATQRQVDVLTKHLQDRERILSLGDRAISSSPNSGVAMRELLNLWKASLDAVMKEAARDELARVRSFWGGGSFYLSPSYQITSLNGKAVKESTLTTCELLVALRSRDWKDRARSAHLLNRGEKGVPEALVNAMADDCLEVASRAKRSLVEIAGELDMEMLPDPDDLQKWWAKQGPSITAKLVAPAWAKN